MFKRFMTLFFLSVVTACVTTGESRVSKVDKDKAYAAHVELGLTYLKRDSRESSRRHLEKAVKLKPDAAPAHNGFGLLYQLTGETELAEKSFKKSLSEAPNYSEGRVNYGRFLYELGRYQEAYDQFEKASQDVSFPRRALALTYLGQSALKLDNNLKAKSSFQHAANLDNKLALAMIELGDLYYDEQNYAESKRYLDQYVALVGRTSRSLWLGIRIERVFGNKDKEASYALALKNLYPYSKEYLLYKKALEKNW